MVAPHSTTLTARRNTSRGNPAAEHLMSRSPRASANAARTSTASVVTLMPPAVEADPPPTNISMSIDEQREPVHLPNVDSGKAARPRHDREEERRSSGARSDLGRPACSGCSIPGPQGDGAEHDEYERRHQGEFHVHGPAVRVRHPLASAKITGNPRLPRKTPMAITDSIHGSVANGASPSTCGTNPVFVNAEVAK